MVTNVELDHHDTYRSLGELEGAFAELRGPAERAGLGRGWSCRPAGAGVSYGIGSGELLPSASSCAAGPRFEWRTWRGAGGARAPQRAERARRRSPPAARPA